MSQIKAKVGIIKSKEQEEKIHDNFKNNFNIDLKKSEKEESSFHGSVNNFDAKNIGNKKPKVKSIFDVISQKK